MKFNLSDEASKRLAEKEEQKLSIQKEKQLKRREAEIKANAGLANLCEATIAVPEIARFLAANNGLELYTTEDEASVELRINLPLELRHLHEHKTCGPVCLTFYKSYERKKKERSDATLVVITIDSRCISKFIYDNYRIEVIDFLINMADPLICQKVLEQAAKK